MEILFVIAFMAVAAQARLRADFKDWGGRKMDAASSRLENRRDQLRNDAKGNGPLAWLARVPGRAALAAVSGLWGVGRSLRQGAKEGAERGRQEFASRYPDLWEKKQDRKARRREWWTRRTRQADPAADPTAPTVGPNLKKDGPIPGPGPAPAVTDRTTGAGRVDPLKAGQNVPRSGPAPSPGPTSVGHRKNGEGLGAGLPHVQPKPDGYVSESERDASHVFLELDKVGRIFPPLTDVQREGFTRRAAGEAVPMAFQFKVRPMVPGDGTPPAVERYVQDTKRAVPRTDDYGTPAARALPPELRGGDLVAWSALEPQKYLPGAVPPVFGETYPTPAPLRVVGSNNPTGRPAGGARTQKEGPTMSGDVSSIDSALAVLNAAKQNARAYLEDAKAEIQRAAADAQVAERLVGFAAKAGAPAGYATAMKAAAEGPIAAVGAAKAKLGAAELSLTNIDKAIAENMKQKQVQEAARAAGGAMNKSAYQPQ